MGTKGNSWDDPEIADDRHSPHFGGFDVTATIGHVEFSDIGTMTPGEAAMGLIGKHDAEGHYTYPLSNGQVCHVDVEYRDA